MEDTEAADLHTHGKRKRRIYREHLVRDLKLFELITMLRCHATQLRRALSLRTSGRKGQRIRVLGRTTVR